MNQRTLKFRAWNIQEKKMVFGYPNLRNNHFYEFAPIDGLGTDFRVCEIMQFTGLHDKNGKEIYEGDILSAEDWSGNKLTVEWGNHIGNHSVGRIIGFEMPDEHLEPGRWEIIGNIYENPELLANKN